MEKSYNKYYNPEVNQKAVAKYCKANYDNLTVRVYKGEKDIIKAHADSLGVSVNTYIRSLLVADGVLPNGKQ